MDYRKPPTEDFRKILGSELGPGRSGNHSPFGDSVVRALADALEQQLDELIDIGRAADLAIEQCGNPNDNPAEADRLMALEVEQYHVYKETQKILEELRCLRARHGKVPGRRFCI